MYITIIILFNLLVFALNLWRYIANINKGEYSIAGWNAFMVGFSNCVVISIIILLMMHTPCIE